MMGEMSVASSSGQWVLPLRLRAKAYLVALMKGRLVERIALLQAKRRETRPFHLPPPIDLAVAFLSKSRSREVPPTPTPASLEQS